MGMPSSQIIAPRPRLFLGSSNGGRHVAEMLRAGLDDVAQLTSWHEGESAPSARAFDAAIFVLCAAPGHGVLLRLGVFLGVLGRERLLVCPASLDLGMPAELEDLTVAPEASAIKEHLSRSAGSDEFAAPSSPTAVSPVAQRRRRALGTAHSVRPEQTLRIADISLTGALLESFGEIPEHQVLDLELALDNGARVHVTAEVVRIQYPQWGRVGGVGVRFIRFAGDSRAILERYLTADPGGLAAAAGALTL